MDERIKITRVEFRNFKAFKNFSIRLAKTNILVGPNNAGKSTLLHAFRVLNIGIRRANARKPELVEGQENLVLGYPVAIDNLPFSLENAATDYDTETPSYVKFHYSNGNSLVLNFLPNGSVTLVPTDAPKRIQTPSGFKKEYPTKIGIIPVLGPLEYKEELLDERTIKRNISTHRASRNFRNYWHYYPDKFEEFSELMSKTWPGMKIEKPELVNINELAMFCIENRIPREVFWAGFGFQIWCQLLTHIIQNEEADIVVVDEPDIYLHPDHQRQILSLLRNVGPDVIVATHSTEMIAEADPKEIVIIDKKSSSGRRLDKVDQIQSTLDLLGSNQNIILTKLSRTLKVLFVEGNDFKIISRFANIMQESTVANQSNFTVVPIDGFENWGKIKALGWGFEKTLGKPLKMGAVFDRDYRCDEEVASIIEDLESELDFVHFHDRKEIENHLLIPELLDIAIKRRVSDIARRKGTKIIEVKSAESTLKKITSSMKGDIQARYIDFRTMYFKSVKPSLAGSTVTKDAIDIFDSKWRNISSRLKIVPGKKVFSSFNNFLQKEYGFNVSSVAVIGRFNRTNIPDDMFSLIKELKKFQSS